MKFETDVGITQQEQKNTSNTIGLYYFCIYKVTPFIDLTGFRINLGQTTQVG